LAIAHSEAVQGLLGPRKLKDNASRFDPACLPTDWRGYLGFAAILLTSEEWSGLAPDARRGVEDWVALGGRLSVFGGGQDTQPLGFGHIQGVPGVTSAQKIIDAIGRGTNETYSLGWPPAVELGQPALPTMAISLSMVAFAVLVGPINLWVFCRGTRRYRVFFTTPLLSLGASLVLAATIVFKDGLGGSGERQVAIALMPDRHEAAILQEQVARTGVLLGHAFPASEPLAIDFLNLESESGLFRPPDLRRHDETYSGDWFRSRFLQAHFLETVRASRSRLELLHADGGETPSVLSTLPDTLENLYWHDDHDRYWHATNVAPGHTVALQLTSEKEFLARFWVGQNVRWGPILQARVGPTLPAGHACGNAPHSQAAMGTLEALRWQRDDALYFQPLR